MSETYTLDMNIPDGNYVAKDRVLTRQDLVDPPTVGRKPTPRAKVIQCTPDNSLAHWLREARNLSGDCLLNLSSGEYESGAARIEASGITIAGNNSTVALTINPDGRAWEGIKSQNIGIYDVEIFDLTIKGAEDPLTQRNRGIAFLYARDIYLQNVTCERTGGGLYFTKCENVELVNCVDIDVYQLEKVDEGATSYYQQKNVHGIFATGCKGLRIYKHISTGAGKGGNIVKEHAYLPTYHMAHGMYIQLDCTEVDIIACIVVDASGTGIMCRPGGQGEHMWKGVKGCLVMLCPSAITFGNERWGRDDYHIEGPQPKGTCSNNVVLYGRHYDNHNPPAKSSMMNRAFSFMNLVPDPVATVAEKNLAALSMETEREAVGGIGHEDWVDGVTVKNWPKESSHKNGLVIYMRDEVDGDWGRDRDRAITDFTRLAIEGDERCTAAAFNEWARGKAGM